MACLMIWEISVYTPQPALFLWKPQALRNYCILVIQEYFRNMIQSNIIDEKIGKM